jgi:alkyldihydroxyacetonephosphate synthase
MTASQSALSRDAILAGLNALVGADHVITDPDQLKASSVDRFRKYTALHHIYDGPIPAAIVAATSTDAVAKVLSWCNANRVNVVPRTGRTATEGGLETVVENSIVLDGSAMNRIISIDPTNMQATAQCGVGLEQLENACRELGLTTAHSPQSKPLAQMGGLVATRSIGQLSTLYGGIEDMVVGLEAVFPSGHVIRIKNVPRRAAGPDIRHVVIGNEGTLCFITEVTVKLFKYEPANTRFRGYLIDDMSDGLDIIRQVVISGLRPAVCRVYSPEDARQHWDWNQDKCVLIFSAEGLSGIVDATIREIDRITSSRDVTPVEEKLISDWFANLNWGLDKIEAEKEWMLTKHNLGYTTEISANWSDVAAIYNAVIERIHREFAHAADLTMLGAHSSHSYQTGTNLYFVYDYNIECQPREEITEYHIPINAIIVEEALAHGGSMVHHHGIGKYRTPWTKEEHGSAYWILEKLKETFDPNGIMNTGDIFPIEDER